MQRQTTTRETHHGRERDPPDSGTKTVNAADPRDPNDDQQEPAKAALMTSLRMQR